MYIKEIHEYTVYIYIYIYHISYPFKNPSPYEDMCWLFLNISGITPGGGQGADVGLEDV